MVSILLGLQFPLFLSLVEIGGDRSEKGNGSRVTAACLSPPIRSSQIADCYTGQLVYAECGTR